MAKRFERLVHYGRIEDGRLVLNNQRWFRGMVAMYEPCRVDITVERHKVSKSREQLGYYWGVVLPEIAMHTGYSNEELHDIFKAKFLRTKKLWRGSELMTTGSTADLSVGEMAEFMANVILEANELGIDIPDADKLYQFK